MNITTHNQVNFKGLTPSSKADIKKEINALRKTAPYSEVIASLNALKRLSAKADDYTVVYCRDAIILNSKNPNYRSTELVKGFFLEPKLADFLDKASQYIEKEKLRSLTAPNKNSLFRRCISKITKLFKRIK